MPEPFESLADDETVFRRIPRWESHFSPPNYVTSANFKLNLKAHEEGISVYMASLRTPESVLAVAELPSGSFLLRAMVKDIRNLRNTLNESLELEVFEVPIEGDSGHAEIRKQPPGSRITPSVAKALRDIFVECLKDPDWQFGPRD